jgi:signal transduction histidine kinase
MGEMLSMIAHQWRQPLATISAKEIAIKMAIELEHYDVKKKEQREAFFAFLNIHLEDIENNVKYLSQTISNFKDFYKPRTHSECFDINSVVQKAYEMIKDTFEADAIAIFLELDAKSEVLLYENEFMQVILNILTNAQEQFEVSGTKNAKIFLRTFEDEKFVIVAIEDNGGGIQQSDLEKLFDPYFSTKMEKNGTGLGLYMAKIILERYHKSTIVAENINQGAKFTIKIKKSKECKIF